MKAKSDKIEWLQIDNRWGEFSGDKQLETNPIF